MLRLHGLSSLLDITDGMGQNAQCIELCPSHRHEATDQPIVSPPRKKQQLPPTRFLEGRKTFSKRIKA